MEDAACCVEDLEGWVAGYELVEVVEEGEEGFAGEVVGCQYGGVGAEEGGVEGGFYCGDCYRFGLSVWLGWCSRSCFGA